MWYLSMIASPGLDLDSRAVASASGGGAHTVTVFAHPDRRCFLEAGLDPHGHGHDHAMAVAPLAVTTSQVGLLQTAHYWANARTQDWRGAILPAILRYFRQGAIQVLRNAIFLEIGPPPTPS